MQALVFREEQRLIASHPGLDRVAAIVEAALGRVPDSVEELLRLYKELGKRAYRMLVVLQREDEPEPSVLELRCLEPRGPTARAEELGLVFEAGGRRCLVYPG